MKNTIIDLRTHKSFIQLVKYNGRKAAYTHKASIISGITEHNKNNDAGWSVVITSLFSPLTYYLSKPFI